MSEKTLPITEVNLDVDELRIAILKARQTGGYHPRSIPERDDYSLLRGYLQSHGSLLAHVMFFGSWGELWLIRGYRFLISTRGLYRGYTDAHGAYELVTDDESQAIAYLRPLPETNE